MHANASLLSVYRPRRLADIVGQPHVVSALQSIVANPGSLALIFHGPSGVGKTAAAWCLAEELGCDPEWGGVTEIPSGTQDGRAVQDLLRSLHLRPLGGSGWKVAIVNEADRMSDQAEAIWLDGLERLPSKCLVIFTTNNLRRMSDRFRRRCEVYQFDGSSAGFRKAMESLVKRIWKKETGKALSRVPDGLGKFEIADNAYSIGLAVQQIATHLRSGTPLPASFFVPFIRDGEPAEPERTAKQRTFCPVCERWIKKGEPVKSHAGHDGKRRWCHSRCSV